jgi:ureidoacrylate peracid hydrolase
MKRYLIILLLMIPVIGHATKEHEGIPVPENFEELIDPQHCAIIVVDMQNNWVSTEGDGSRKDKERKPDPSKHSVVPGYEKQVKAMQKLLKSARDNGVLVTYAEFIHTYKTGSTSMSGWYFYNDVKPSAVEGTWGAKTIRDLEPKKGDYVIPKGRGNTFYKTYLEDLLKERLIRTVILTGTATGGCVAATTFGAFERGFYPVMVRDCIDQHESLFFQWMESQLPMYDSDELIAGWEKINKQRNNKDSTTGKPMEQK